jgi:hypothetical protein
MSNDLGQETARKEQLPPSQLNKQLIKLLASLPSSGGVDEALTSLSSLVQDSDSTGPTLKPGGYEIVTNILQNVEQVADRRGHSEYKDRLMQKFDELMSHAKVTQACKDYLRWGFEHTASYGVGQDLVDVHGFMLGDVAGFNHVDNDFFEDPNSGGIFDESIALGIDYHTYGLAIRNQKLLEAWGEYQSELWEAMDLGHGFSPKDISDAERESRNKVDMNFLSLPALHEGAPLWGAQSLEDFAHKGKDYLGGWALQLEQTHGKTPTEELTGPISD